MTTSAGLSASLQARFGLSGDGVSVVADCEAPLELRGPFRGGALPLFYLRNTTCGILNGDSYSYSFQLAENARTQIASSSAAKVLASARGTATTTVRIDAAAGSHLVWGTHPLILQEGAHLSQRTHCRVAEGATLLMAEVLVLGRIARGERLSFESYESELIVESVERGRLYEERSRLLPDSSLAASLHGAGAIVSFYGIGISAEAGEQLVALCDRSDLYAGCSDLPNKAGYIVRALAPTLSAGLSICNTLLGTPV